MHQRALVFALAATALMLFGFGGGLVGQAGASPAHVAAPVGHAAPAVQPASAKLSSIPATGATSSTPHLSDLAQREAASAATQAMVKSSGVPSKYVYPPNFLAPITATNGVVTPIAGAGPAPMGIGTYGVNNESGTPVATLNFSHSWEGSVTINSANVFYLDDSSIDFFGGQLNDVLTNVTTWGQKDTFWNQNVFFYEPSTGTFEMIDNIWNFSCSTCTGSEPATTFADFGTGGVATGGFYYNEYALTVPVAMPFTLNLWTNSSVTNFTGLNPLWGVTNEDPTVDFGFQLISGGAVVASNSAWDQVLFNSTEAPSATAASPMYEVNGAHVNPTGFIPYDAELMLGGPGGGSDVSFYGINATMQLHYWDPVTSSYLNAPNVWDVGSETGETSDGIAEHYTTPGTVILEGGPSLIMPLWGATPGAGPGGSDGNIGTLTVSGTISPDNAFLFLNTGTGYDPTAEGWAPTLPGGTFSYDLPPGSYFGAALMSDYDPVGGTWTGGSSTTLTTTITMTADSSQGIYTPLFAWNNFQLGNVSVSGAGTVASPYIISGAQYQLIWSQFGEVNDYFFPVFPAILFDGTTANAIITGLPPLEVQYAGYDLEVATFFGLPSDNDLQIQLYNTVAISLEGNSQISGFLTSTQQGFGDLGEVMLWNAAGSLILGNTITDQGLGLVLLDSFGTEPSGNVVYDNVFNNGLLPTSGGYSYSYRTGIEDAEPGDTIANNYFATDLGSFSPAFSEFTGAPQTNLDSWNLPAPIASNTGVVVNGFSLPAGSIVGLPWVCGNYWDDAFGYIAWTTVVPYTDGNSVNPAYGISAGGDACPTGPDGMVTYTTTYTETGLASGTSWSITDGSQTFSALAGTSIMVQDPNGSWSYTVGGVAGYTATPSSGSNTVAGAATSVAVAFAHYVIPEYLVSVTETGLPAGTSWSIVVGTATLSSTSSSISWTAVNGTYPYTANAVADYTISSGATGSLIVSGSPSTAAVVFAPNAGTVSGSINPSNANLWINGVAVTPASGAYTDSLAPGTYVVWASATGYASYWNNVTVTAGGTTTLDIVLTPLLYTFGIGETGLPAGTTWSVVVGGHTWTSVDGASTITSSEIDGSYAVTVNAVANYKVNASSFTEDVSGGAAWYWVTFTPTSGTLSGTIYPSTASLWINGAAVTASSGSYTDTLAPGTYTVWASATGFAGYWNNVTVSAGTTMTLNIHMTWIPLIYNNMTGKTQYSNTSTAGSLTSTGGLEGIIVGLVLGLVVGIVLMMMLKRKPKEGGAESWDSGKKSSAVAEETAPSTGSTSASESSDDVKS